MELRVERRLGVLADRSKLAALWAERVFVLKKRRPTVAFIDVELGLRLGDPLRRLPICAPLCDGGGPLRFPPIQAP